MVTDSGISRDIAPFLGGSGSGRFPGVQCAGLAESKRNTTLRAMVEIAATKSPYMST